MTRNRSIGEMSIQSGLSIRSLRYLEAKGLISPKRTEAGRRVYGGEEVTRITRILVLRQAGYPLSTISTAMLTPSLDARSLVETQILQLNAKHKQISAMLSRLRHTMTLLETRDALDVDSLCSLIKEAQDIMTQNDLKNVARQYFSEEEWERWRDVGSRLFPGEARTQYEQDWSALISRVELAIASDVAPGSPESIQLLNEWMALQNPMIEALGKEHWTKAAKMYSEMDQWQSETAKAPFSAEVYRFINETGRLAKMA
ncbi:MerR family transcriptional regulator [Asaia astilbis]